MNAEVRQRAEAELEKVQARIREQKRLARDQAGDRDSIAKITLRLRALHTRRTEIEHSLAVHEVAKS